MLGTLRESHRLEEELLEHSGESIPPLPNILLMLALSLGLWLLLYMGASSVWTAQPAGADSAIERELQ
jgi:hypothetical protein